MRSSRPYFVECDGDDGGNKQECKEREALRLERPEIRQVFYGGQGEWNPCVVTVHKERSSERQYERAESHDGSEPDGSVLSEEEDHDGQDNE